MEFLQLSTEQVTEFSQQNFSALSNATPYSDNNLEWY